MVSSTSALRRAVQARHFPMHVAPDRTDVFINEQNFFDPTVCKFNNFNDSALACNEVNLFPCIVAWEIINCAVIRFSNSHGGGAEKSERILAVRFFREPPGQ